MRKLILGAALIANSSFGYASEIGSGQLQLKLENSATVKNAVMLSAQADIEVTAMTAKVTLFQTFQNTSSAWAHGTYVFPLPEDAAVNDFSFQIGERTIDGHIEERKKAKQQFAQAKHDGKQAALVESNRPNLFSLSLANIPPGAKITSKLVYLQTVAYQHGVFSLRLPTTLTPRYIPGKPIFDSFTVDDKLQAINAKHGWSYSTNQEPDANLITPFQTRDKQLDNKIEIRARLLPGFELAQITSASHNIEWQTEQEQWLVKLSQNTSPMNRDFELSWAAKTGLEPAAAMFVEDDKDARYASIMLMPPQPAKNDLAPLLRDIVFVIDSSGSMAGDSMRQAKRSLLFALRRLKSADRFEIIDFDNVARSLFGSLREVNDQSLRNAAHFVQNLDADGGTEIGIALRTAFGGETDEQRLKQIVFITDGSVGNEAELLALIHKQLGNARLFTVGIGSAPNSYFMRKAAESGKGSYTYVDSLDEVEHEMSSLFTQLEHPLLRDITITWPEGGKVESYPSNIQDLYVGEPLLIKSKFSAQSGKVTVSGKLKNQTWQRTLSLPKAGTHQNIATLWARAKIENLMDGFQIGKTEAQIKPAVLKLALNHQLASKYTSFIAIDSKPTRPQHAKANDHKIANLMPAGTTMAAPWPNTATSAQLSLYLSLPFLIAGLLFWRRQRNAL